MPARLPSHRRLTLGLATLSAALNVAASAQMVPVRDATGVTPELPSTGNSLYVSAPAGDGAPQARAASTSQPAGLPRAVILPPKPRPVRDLPAPGGDTVRVRPFRAVAFGLTASTLGPGAEMALPLARTLNLRIGGSYLNVRYPFAADGIQYTPGIKFVSGRGTLDWFPHHGGFHVSAGALYFRNTIAGSAGVPVGRQFNLGDTTYTNSVDDPVNGNASLAYARQVAPMLLIGFGNLLPRSGRHISVPIELGGAYMQPPTLNLKLAGTACTTQGCFNAATDPQVQRNLAAEVQKLQSDIRFLQVYPIVSVGLACRF